jgi:uncharacterized protein YjbI with pentapeptide repeats
LVIVIISVCGYVFDEWEWTGLINPRPRTFWDWLHLLIVPIVLGLGGYLFTRSESRWTQDVADQRAQDEALQAYLDKISELLIDGKLHHKADPYDAMRVTARARTLAILRRLDGRRKRTVLLFLRESRLINSKALCRNGRVVAHARLVGLADADLKNADLRGARLISTDDREAVSLERVNLEGSDLSGAILQCTDLSGANLSKANLKGANLTFANLSSAIRPDGSILRRTDLSGADLSDADLSDANLKGARVTDEQLKRTKSLRGATMINSLKYEDWVKGEAREEDVRSSGPA